MNWEHICFAWDHKTIRFPEKMVTYIARIELWILGWSKRVWSDRSWLPGHRCIAGTEASKNS